MSNYRRLYVKGGCYFFTAVTYRLREAIIYTRQRYQFKINAWVLLPDHLHCIWTLPENDADFSTRWAIIKNASAKQQKLIYSNPN